jgi:hypothetical protein
MLTMRERLLGFFKVVSIQNGGQLPHSCGFMANVHSLHSLHLNTSLTCILTAGSGKSVLWFVDFLLFLKYWLKLRKVLE